MILTLWDSGDWIQDCPECGAHALHVLTAGGSPLSGSGGCSGICRECLDQRGPAHAWHHRKSDGNFNSLYGPARKVAESFANPLNEVEQLPAPEWKWSETPEKNPEPPKPERKFPRASLVEVVEGLREI